MTTTLHIDNTVHDFDAWKTVFDKFDRFRAEHQVRSYRISRVHDAPGRILIDLDFDTRAEAETFRADLGRVTATPQAQSLLITHTSDLVDVVEERVPVTG